MVKTEYYPVKRFLLIFALQLLCCVAQAQVFVHRPPLYIVNGERMSEAQVKAIDPDDIVSNTLLPADEAAVEKYGQEASNGVILISLRYDTPAHFEHEGKPMRFADYVAERVKWEYPANPVARVVLRLSISAEGDATECELIDASDKRLLKRIRGVLEQSPRWVPAMKDGKGVEDDYILRLTLPRGKTVQDRRSVPVIVGGV